jgi:hypothetical protein
MLHVANKINYRHMKNNSISRRAFVKKSAVGVGAVGVVANLTASSHPISDQFQRKPYLAGFSCEGLRTETSEQMVNEVEERLRNLLSLQPDIIALPELFGLHIYMKKTCRSLRVYQTNCAFLIF